MALDCDLVCGTVLALPAISGDTALHIACSCIQPDLQLVSALVAAGARPAAPRTSDGNTPLHLAVKAGGQAGLALAKAMLQPGVRNSGQQSSLWCPPSTDCEGAAAAAADYSSTGGLDAANITGQTAVGLAAAAVLGALRDTAQGGRAAGSTAALGAADAQQELLALLLSQGPQLPEELAVSLLQHGFTGRLSDRLTAQVGLMVLDRSHIVAFAGLNVQGVPPPEVELSPARESMCQHTMYMD